MPTETTVRKHPTRSGAYTVHSGGQIVGVVQRLAAHCWRAELAGGELSRPYGTRKVAVDAVLRTAIRRRLRVEDFATNRVRIATSSNEHGTQAGASPRR